MKFYFLVIINRHRSALLNKLSFIVGVIIIIITIIIIIIIIIIHYII